MPCPNFLVLVGVPVMLIVRELTSFILNLSLSLEVAGFLHSYVEIHFTVLLFSVSNFEVLHTLMEAV